MEICSMKYSDIHRQFAMWVWIVIFNLAFTSAEEGDLRYHLFDCQRKQQVIPYNDEKTLQTLASVRRRRAVHFDMEPPFEMERKGFGASADKISYAENNESMTVSNGGIVFSSCGEDCNISMEWMEDQYDTSQHCFQIFYSRDKINSCISFETESSGAVTLIAKNLTTASDKINCSQFMFITKEEYEGYKKDRYNLLNGCNLPSQYHRDVYHKMKVREKHEMNVSESEKQEATLLFQPSDSEQKPIMFAVTRKTEKDYIFNIGFDGLSMTYDEENNAVFQTCEKCSLRLSNYTLGSDKCFTIHDSTGENCFKINEDNLTMSPTKEMECQKFQLSIVKELYFTDCDGSYFFREGLYGDKELHVERIQSVDKDPNVKVQEGPTAMQWKVNVDDKNLALVRAYNDLGHPKVELVKTSAYVHIPNYHSGSNGCFTIWLDKTLCIYFEHYPYKKLLPIVVSKEEDALKCSSFSFMKKEEFGEIAKRNSRNIYTLKLSNGPLEHAKKKSTLNVGIIHRICEVKSKKRTKWTFYWNYPDGKYTIGAHLIVRGLQFRSGGVYTCTATNNEGIILEKSLMIDFRLNPTFVKD